MDWIFGNSSRTKLNKLKGQWWHWTLGQNLNELKVSDDIKPKFK